MNEAWHYIERKDAGIPFPLDQIHVYRHQGQRKGGKVPDIVDDRKEGQHAQFESNTVEYIPVCIQALRRVICDIRGRRIDAQGCQTRQQLPQVELGDHPEQYVLEVQTVVKEHKNLAQTPFRALVELFEVSDQVGRSERLICVCERKKRKDEQKCVFFPYLRPVSHPEEI